MATIRSSNKSVLLVVDVQQGVLKNAGQPQGIIKNIDTLIGRARTAAVPVVWLHPGYMSRN